MRSFTASPAPATAVVGRPEERKLAERVESDAIRYGFGTGDENDLVLEARLGREPSVLHRVADEGDVQFAAHQPIDQDVLVEVLVVVEDVGVLLPKPRQRPRQRERARERVSGEVDSLCDRLGLRGEPVLELPGRLSELPAFPIEDLSLGGERDRPPLPSEETDPEFLLEGVDVEADDGLAQRELPPGAAEAPGLRRRQKDAHPLVENHPVLL